MSYQDGWDALNLRMPPRVPHYEPSLYQHWGVLKRLTGIEVRPDSDEEAKLKGSRELVKIFNYDYIFSVLIGGGVFGDKRTDMGHAVYQAGGTDFRQAGKALYDDPEKALKFDPWELYGTVDEKKAVADFNAHWESRKAAFPDVLNMTGIYVTCMSGLIEIFGWDMLLEAAGTDPEGFGEVANRYTDWMLQYAKALAKCDSPAVMIHDDTVWTSGAFIHPDWYRRYVFPNYLKLFAPLKEAGKLIMYTCDGNYTEFIDDVVATGVNSLMMEPATDMAYVAEKYGKAVSFAGNADTRVLLLGTKEDIRAEVKRCMDTGKKYPGYFISVSNHVPPNTPVDSVLYYKDAFEEMGRR
ncbi:MAG: hypothetical protein LBD96_06165 [Treponema sp.]|jgi:hypothetical protein|nr:hypothetical protein [Treponema sp.]